MRTSELYTSTALVARLSTEDGSANRIFLINCYEECHDGKGKGGSNNEGSDEWSDGGKCKDGIYKNAANFIAGKEVLIRVGMREQ